MLIDAHAHLEMKDFDADREAVLERAASAGVEYIITVGTNLKLSQKALSLASRYNNVFATIGIHPHDANTATEENLAKIREIARHPKIVGYGEIGLDFFRDLAPREKQKEAFARQLKTAADLGLPVVIHDREAHDLVLKMVEDSGVRRGVFHCFSGSYQMAEKCTALGFYISIPGTVTFDKTKKTSDVVKNTPLDFLLLETDCPYLAPVPCRGKRNEPSFIIHTAKKVAQIKSLPWEEVAQVTSRNAKKLFGFVI